MTIPLAMLFSMCLAGTALEPKAPMTDVWTVIGVDPKGDGRDPSLADAAQLSYRYEKQGDMLWFRVTLFGKPNADAFGVSIAVDTTADDADRMNWWGANKDFKFDRLITAWVTRSAGGYQGTVGVSDSAGARERHLTNLLRNNLQLSVDGASILIGLKRADLTEKMKMHLIAAVGSDKELNDEIPNLRSAALDLSAPRPSRGLREIDVSRNNFRFARDYRPLPDGKPPRILRSGRGARTLILIPGVYSGDAAFDGFIARNESAYAFNVITPPGLNGTAARQLPPETTSYGEFTWTRQLARDIVDFIKREHLDKPIIVAHGFPGSLAAEQIALNYPYLLGGIVEIASMPAQYAPSWRNPGREATPEERVAIVDESWAQLWFKYVTPETWESNNYPAKMLANDPDRGERARQQAEAAPLPVKIRYLIEYMASDQRADFGKLSVPVLALKPGFNPTLLADPAYGWFKASFQDRWDAVPKNPRLELITIPDARALMLDDQPTQTDRAIAAFVEANSRRTGSGEQTLVRQPRRVSDWARAISILRNPLAAARQLARIVLAQLGEYVGAIHPFSPCCRSGPWLGLSLDGIGAAPEEQRHEW
jgi:pimeloyl-ACP methyl ester carboxylesterase